MRIKGSTIWSLGIVLIIFGGIFGFTSLQEGVASMRPYVDLYGDETNVSEIGYFDMVEADIWAVIDCFASEVTKENGVKTDEDYFYIIPAFEGEDQVFIGVKVNDNSYRTYEKIRTITYKYLTTGDDSELGSTTVSVVGCLKKMKSDVKKYYYEWFEENEWFESQEEMEKYAPAVYIEIVAKPEAGRVFLFIGAGLLTVGLCLLIGGIVKDRGQEKRSAGQSYVVINGVSYPKSTFNHVNQCINSQERIFAAQELHEITGVSLDEAGEIINHWSKYYY